MKVELVVFYLLLAFAGSLGEVTEFDSYHHRNNHGIISGCEHLTPLAGIEVAMTVAEVSGVRCISLLHDPITVDA